MRNKETGEFELVIGNGQLLSGFFIIVLLLVVTFAMGYVVGQNSPRSARPQTDASAAAQSPEPAPPAQQASVAPPASPSDDAGETTPPPADAPPQPVTQPARDETPAQAPSASEVAAAPGTPDDNLAAGLYLQLGAWKQPSGPEDLVKTLKDKGYPASLTTGTDKLIHLMVGPYPDAQAANVVKRELETRLALHSFLVRK